MKGRNGRIQASHGTRNDESKKHSSDGGGMTRCFPPNPKLNYFRHNESTQCYPKVHCKPRRK